MNHLIRNKLKSNLKNYSTLIRNTTLLLLQKYEYKKSSIISFDLLLLRFLLSF